MAEDVPLTKPVIEKLARLAGTSHSGAKNYIIDRLIAKLNASKNPNHLLHAEVTSGSKNKAQARVVKYVPSFVGGVGSFETATYGKARVRDVVSLSNARFCEMLEECGVADAVRIVYVAWLGAIKVFKVYVDCVEQRIGFKMKIVHTGNATMEVVDGATWEVHKQQPMFEESSSEPIAAVQKVYKEAYKLDIQAIWSEHLYEMRELGKVTLLYVSSD